MKRISTALLVTVISSLFLAACASSPAAAPEPQIVEVIKEVIKEVPVEVVKEVPVEVVKEVEVVREVEV